jgi:hypothetical protein
MILTDSGGTAFTPCPAGSYTARCIQLIDLGTQVVDWQGQAKHQRKVLVTWEIIDDETRREDGTPFTISKRYTQSLHEKAGLRKDLASWRGRDFTPEELRGFNLESVLGQPCLLNVIHEVKPDGKTFANIASLMKLPRGMVAPVATEPLVHFDLAQPNWQTFAGLSSRLQTQIATSPEYQAIPNKPTSVAVAAPAPTPTRPAAPAPTPVRQPAPAAAPAGSGFDDMDDDIPF